MPPDHGQVHVPPPHFLSLYTYVHNIHQEANSQTIVALTALRLNHFLIQADIPTYMGIIDDTSKAEISMDTDQTGTMRKYEVPNHNLLSVHKN